MDTATWLKIVATLITIAVGIYGLVKFIDSRARKVIQEPDFIKNIATSLRPYAIFDEKEKILVDRGAMKFIGSIEVRINDENKLPNEILIHPIHHLDQAPILIPLDTDISEIKETRGKKFDWIYEIEYHGYTDREQRKFSIEVIS